MTKLPSHKTNVGLPWGYRALEITDRVEPGDEFYSTTFTDWYAVKDEQIGHLAKGALFVRPEKKEEINQAESAQ